MDDIDRELMIFIARNPRVSCQELAKRLGISRQAVHRRMQALKEAGVIEGMNAGISIPYLDAVTVGVFGKSETASIDDTLDRLGRSEYTRKVDVAGGNYLYITGFLRSVYELDHYSEFVRREAKMLEPTVGVLGLDDDLMEYPLFGSGKRKRSYRKLSPLDLRIVASLKDDARRPTADIADMLGVSSSTVKRHLERMMSDGSVDLYSPMDPSLGGDLFLIMHVNLRNGADKVDVGRRVLAKHLFRDQFVRTMTNLPNLIFWVFWTDRIADVRKAFREISRDEAVLSAVPNVVYLSRTYKTWRDELPQDTVHSTAKTRARPASPD